MLPTCYQTTGARPRLLVDQWAHAWQHVLSPLVEGERVLKRLQSTALQHNLDKCRSSDQVSSGLCRQGVFVPSQREIQPL